MKKFLFICVCMLTAMAANAQTEVNSEKEAEKLAKQEAKAQAQAEKEAAKAAKAEAKAQAKEAKEAEKAAAKAAKEAAKANAEADKAAAQAAKSEAEAQALAEKEAAKQAKAEAKLNEELVEDVDSAKWRIKTNALLWVMGNANVDLEYKLADQWSLEFEATGNFIKFGKQRQWKNFQFGLEGRYWLDQAFKGHFFGLHFNWGRYWIGRVSTPWGSFHKHFFYRGWGIRTGITYGYNWKLSKHWDLEAMIGLGLIFTNYDNWMLRDANGKPYDRVVDAPYSQGYVNHEHKVTFSPTRLSLGFAYRF